MRQALTNESGTGYRRVPYCACHRHWTGQLSHLCPKISAGNPDVDCHTHPHNFYIQLLGETGLIGLALGVAMVVSIIWACLRANLANRRDVLAATCFVVPFGLFFPVQSTADFFGQWNNTFMWSAIAFALVVAHKTSSPKHE